MAGLDWDPLLEIVAFRVSAERTILASFSKRTERMGPAISCFGHRIHAKKGSDYFTWQAAFFATRNYRRGLLFVITVAAPSRPPKTFAASGWASRSS